MRIRATLAALLAAAGAAAVNLPNGSARSESCAGTTVRYSVTRIGIPHVDVRGLTGHLFYYTGTTLMDGRVNRSDGLVIYAGGKNGNLATKILWTLPKGAAHVLRISGRRLDGDGSFGERWTAAGSRDYPSIVDVPSAGCWRLTLTSGRIRRTVVLESIEPVATATCDATRLTPEGAVATPSTSGIVAGWGRDWRTPDGGALMYTRGNTPAGGNTKVLWRVAGRSGPSLELVGRRLDAPGSFRQQFPKALGEAGIFPSILIVPEAGCWLLTVRTAKLAGIVVTQAVDSG